MRYLLTLIISIGLIGTLPAYADKTAQEETRVLKSFSEVSAHEGIRVFIAEGNQEEAKVILLSDKISLDDVLTEVSNGELKIHLKDSKSWFDRKDIGDKIEVYVTYKSIDEISASSSATLKATTPIKADGDFEVSVSSSGDIEAEVRGANTLDIGASSSGDAVLIVSAIDLYTSASSSGDIKVSGTASTHKIKASSSGDVVAKITGLKDLKMSASSSGDIIMELDSVNMVDASVTSGGEIKITGVANSLTVEASSGGDYKGYNLVSKEVEAYASSGGDIRVSVVNKIKAREGSGGSVKFRGDPSYVNIRS